MDSSILKFTILSLIAMCISVDCIFAGSAESAKDPDIAKIPVICKNGSCTAVERYGNQIFTTLHPVISNLSPDLDGSQRAIRLVITLVHQDINVSIRIIEVLPIIVDSLITFLKGVKPSSLSGINGINFLKSAILTRVNLFISPLSATRVLIGDMTIK